MKSWNKILMGLSVLAMLMVGCKPEEKDGKSGNGKTDGETTDAVVYMAVNVTLPPAGQAKSAKGSANLKPDGETGQTYENAVSRMMIVLATYPDNKFITYGTVANPTAVTTGPNTGTVKAVSSMNRDGLNAYYSDKNITNHGQVYVYVFCNYTQPLLDAITSAGRAEGGDGTPKVSSDWIHAVADIADAGSANIWNRGEFLMSNVSQEQRIIPTTLAAWQQNYAKDETTAFNLSGTNTTGEDNSKAGTIKVHRSMARFDLKDGSIENGDNQGKYVMMTKGTGEGDLTVELVRVALVNQSRQFYYLQHVTKDGSVVDLDEVLKRDNQVVCGEESYDFDKSEHTYVVDADAAEAHKKAHQENEKIDAATLPTYFNHPLFDQSGAITSSAREGWQSADIREVFKHADKDTKYAIWTYTTENAVPHSNQRVGVSTGIVFKGKLGYTAGTNDKLKAAIDGVYGQGSDNNYVKELEVDGQKKHYPILYTFGEGVERRLYVGWNDQVKEKVDAGYAAVKGSIAYAAKTANYPEDNPTKSPDDLFQELIAAKGKDGEADALAAFKKSATMADFTLYEASNDVDAGDATNEGGRDAHGPGYYCYYFYWNRHNADNIAGTMSPMEFAVVRNNVYKLCVKSINRFGHPRVTENDPEPLTPDTPCEKDDLYMSVDIQVAPWVVRTNEIEF